MFGPLDYIVYQSERMTYTQAHEKVTAIANMFVHQYGCKKGDRIAIAARNLPEWILCFWVRASLICAATAFLNHTDRACSPRRPLKSLVVSPSRSTRGSSSPL